MKVAICTPFHAFVTSHYAHSLTMLAIRTARQRPDIELKPMMVRTSLLPETRNALVAEALAWGADWLLWVDADQVFPEHSLIRLLSHGKEIVGCNYSRRSFPAEPTAQALDPNWQGGPLWTTREKADADLLEPALTLGLGLCLVSAAIFRRIRARFARSGFPEDYPVFRFDTQRDGLMLGEDRVFFLTMRELGVPVYCDHKLSWDVGHVGELIFSNADTAETLPGAAAAPRRPQN